MKDIKHIFFDLDHTLWDFDRNSAETLTELFEQYQLGNHIPSAEAFVREYKRINRNFWTLYRDGKIQKHELRYQRFLEAFAYFGMTVDQRYAEDFAASYLAICPLKKHVFPGTFEVLDHLKANYPLHIITNGFKEVQDIKLNASGLGNYFDVVLCSEDVGVNKPHPKVFHRAFELAGTSNFESVMIGDTLEADILGAENVGMKSIFFNPEKEVVETKSKQIYHLADLIELFD